MNEFWHMGLTVSDMSRSIAFYRDVVGMEVVRGPFTGGGAGSDDLMQNPGLELQVCWLRHGTFLFQLLQYTKKAGIVLELHHNNVGSPHFSFVIDDVEAKYADIRDHHPDLVLASPIADMETGKSFYVEDPDGLPVEFWEWYEVPSDPVRPEGGPEPLS
jgi:catechol 2,3-dioxygenase-like lactoylglutathione lyase family enzyme